MSLSIHTNSVDLRQLYDNYKQHLSHIDTPQSYDLIETFEKCENSYQTLKAAAKELQGRISNPFVPESQLLSQLLADFKTLHQQQKAAEQTMLPTPFNPGDTGPLDETKKLSIRVRKMLMTLALAKVKRGLEKKTNEAKSKYNSKIQEINTAYKPQLDSCKDSQTSKMLKKAREAEIQGTKKELNRIVLGSRARERLACRAFEQAMKIFDKALAGRLKTAEAVAAALAPLSD